MTAHAMHGNLNCHVIQLCITTFFWLCCITVLGNTIQSGNIQLRISRMIGQCNLHHSMWLADDFIQSQTRTTYILKKQNCQEARRAFSFVSAAYYVCLNKIWHLCSVSFELVGVWNNDTSQNNQTKHGKGWQVKHSGKEPNWCKYPLLLVTAEIVPNYISRFFRFVGKSEQ